MAVFIAGNDYGRLLQMLSRPSQTTSVATLGEKPWDWSFPPNYEEHLASDMCAGTVAIGAGEEDPSLLLQSPLEFLQFIPGSHYFFLYERAGLEVDDSESASEETFDPGEDRHQDDVAGYMLSNLIQLDYSHVQVLRLSGLRYSEDVDRFYSIYDTFINALRTARSVEVLVLHEMHSTELATLVQVLTDNPEYPVLPSLQTIAWSPSSIPDTSVEVLVHLLETRRAIGSPIRLLQVLVTAPGRWCDRKHGIDAKELERRVEGLTKIEIHEHPYGPCRDMSPPCKYMQ